MPRPPSPAVTDPVPLRGSTDWGAVRMDYVVEGLPREQILQKYEVSARLLQLHVRKGDWDALRDELAKRLAEQLRGVPAVSDEALAGVSAQWRQRYRELEQMAVYIQRWLAAHGDAVEPHHINRLTQAERNIVQMQRLLMGESTENVGLVDKAVEQVLEVVERYVPQADRARFRDDISRLLRPAGISPAAVR